jgi:hypothetical protein
MIPGDPPAKITSFGRDGRQLMTFSSPLTYIRRLINLDEGCIATQCGRPHALPFPAGGSICNGPATSRAIATLLLQAWRGHLMALATG